MDTKKSEAKAKDLGHKRKRFPKKKVFKNFFSAISKKNGLEKHFLADLQNFNHSKNSAVLEPRTGRFSRTWGFEAKDVLEYSTSENKLTEDLQLNKRNKNREMRVTGK